MELNENKNTIKPTICVKMKAAIQGRLQCKVLHEKLKDFKLIVQ